MIISTIAADEPSFTRTRWTTLLSMLAVAGLAFLLYSRALDFAFFNDDPTGHFAWMESRSYADYFRSSADYGYYRPIVFVILQGLVDTVSYNARVFHALLLVLNSANVALLWLLIWRLSDSSSYAWATSLIFTFFPFSYEAVTYVASLTHPLLLFWLLLTLLIYQQARRIDQEGWKRITLYATAMITMVLGLLTHENGLIIPLAMAGVEWLEYPPKSVLEAIRRPFLPYLLVTPIFLFLWWSIPKTSEQILPSISSWFSNLFPFLQTLVYPLLPLFDLTAEDTAVLVVLAAMVLAITFLSAWLARAMALWLFGLGWFLLSSLPATLFLSPDYLYGSPRLHYLPSVGVAMMLAMPVLALARRTPDRIWKRVVLLAAGLLYTLAIIIPPTAFISCELDFYEETSRIVRRMGEVGEEAPAGSSLLFVNVPIFFSSYSEHPQGCRNPYPWTPVGAVVMPAYASAKDFVRYNGGGSTLATAVTVAEYAPGWNTFGSAVSPADLRERLHVEQIHVFDLNLGDFYNLSATWLPGGAGDVIPLALFGEGMRLNSAAVGDVQQNETLVTLVWQNESGGTEGAAPTVFVHVYDQSGQLVAQHDGPSGGGFVPPSWWGEQDAIIDRHRIELPADLAPGQYNVAVGLYDPGTGERYTAVTVDGTPLADSSLIIEQLAMP
jgi:hypothetical protein